VPRFSGFTALVFVYTLAIAILMVSRLPVLSGKRVGKRIAPEMVLPVFVAVVACFALLIAYPWIMLTITTLVYLGSLPFGLVAYRKYERGEAGVASAATAPVAPGPAATEAVAPPPPSPDPGPDRPARLN
jgi:CDP-diacylglycerol--serine O-phosphatidyltransferase